MNYLSVCSGIEAATVAWHPLGWTPAAFAEVDKFPSAVLAHHYPNVPNRGDMTRYEEWPDDAIDLLVGGTPCQSFSVAGLRKGMADPRGNLALTYLAIADRYRPEWLVWENVPGVLSSNDGRDFGAFLGGLVELGYGFAYRVLDAQFVRVDGFGRAVPQRRRRVFVVGNSRSWRRSAAVLFERESLSWHSAPRRQAGEESAASTGFGVTGSVTHGYGAKLGTDESCQGSVIAFGAQNSASQGDGVSTEICSTLDKSKTQAIAWSIMPQNSGKDYKARAVDVAQPIMAGGPVGGNQGGDYIQQPVAFDLVQITSKTNRSTLRDVSPTMAKGSQLHAVAFQSSQSGVRVDDVHATLDSNNGSRRHNGVIAGWAVRRLTPTECERLQGFPDGYTNIPWRGKPDAPDGPRYKALGNSMACNAMRWLGRRIDLVNSITSQQAREAA